MTKSAEDIEARVTDASGASLARYIHQNDLTLVLVRHGQRGRPPIEGLIGKSLTPLGHRQAKRVAHRLAQLPIDHIYTSDMARACQTAEHLRALRPQSPFTMLPELREGRMFVPPLPPVRTARDRAQKRLDESNIERFIGRLRHKHKTGHVVMVIAHGGVIRRLVPALAGIRVEKSVLLASHHASVTMVSVTPDGRPLIRLANCTRHLRPSQITGDDLR